MVEPDYQPFIDACETVDELRDLYLNSTEEIQSKYRNQFNQKKYLLQVPISNSLTPQNFTQNGTTNRI